MDSLRWQEIGPSSPCLLLLHLQLLQEGHHVFLGNHILILLHHTVRPIASNHLNGRNWLVPTGPLLPHVPFWGSRWEELDARVPHHLKWEDFQSLFSDYDPRVCWSPHTLCTLACSPPGHSLLQLSPSHLSILMILWPHGTFAANLRYYGHMALLQRISDFVTRKIAP